MSDSKIHFTINTIGNELESIVLRVPSQQVEGVHGFFTPSVVLSVSDVRRIAGFLRLIENSDFDWPDS